MEIFFAFSWLFWAIAAVVVIALATASVNEKPGWFVSILLAGGVGLLFASGHNLNDAWAYVNANPIDVVKWIAIYIGIGVLYAVLRWFFYLRELKAKLLDWRAGYPNVSTPLSEDDRTKFKRDIGYHGTFPPRVSEHKGEVMSHMILWSFCWVELRPLTKLFNFVYGSIAGALQRMSDRMFKGMA